MKKSSTILTLSVIILAFIMSGCEKEEEHVAVPIAPILKEIIMPGEVNSIPGTDVTIYGKGFSTQDVVYLTAELETTPFEVVVVEATDGYITFELPSECAGLYTVSVERDGKTTALTTKLSVPYLVVLENVVFPTEDFARSEIVTIYAEGFQTGDSIRIVSDVYPEGVQYSVPATISSGQLSFVVPEGTYGINSIVVFRGLKQTVLGTLGITSSVGDEIGGGVVFWVDENNIHGYIANRTNTGTAIEQFGPAVVLASAAGTSEEIGTGKSNTKNLMVQLADYRSNFDNDWDTKKPAAELCTELIVTENEITYEDWFLPSRLELKELFLQKSMLATKGATVPANNYWSSTEGPGDAAGWSAYYVNFWEAVNYVSGNSDKEGWKIGIRAIRSF